MGPGYDFIIFRAIFEYFICFFSTRNKERLALIEKALMPVYDKRQDATPYQKLILNFVIGNSLEYYWH
jgi:hypothetical protein